MAWHISRAKTRVHEPRILPGGWRYMSMPAHQFEGIAFVRHDGLKVLFSFEWQDGDSREWLHVSVSRPDRIPSWEDLREIKDIFIGRDRKAVQILPPKDEYVNCHPNVLHLFCCLNQEILPDF